MRRLDGADLPRLAALDTTNLARLLLDATDALEAGSEVELLTVCDHGVARLGALLAFPASGTAALAPLLTGHPAVARHIRVALDAAPQIARRAGRVRLGLTAPAEDTTVRDIAEHLGYELTGAGTTPARPELDLPARDTWILTANTTPSSDDPCLG